jgi:hypothetical protein
MLQSVAAAHAPKPVELVIVESVGEWSKEQGIGNARGDPQAMAIATPDRSKWAVVMRQTIDEGTVESTISLMELRGFEQCRESLSSPAAYARHLVLHELAHLANEWGQERERDCDVWAFERLQGAI